MLGYREDHRILVMRISLRIFYRMIECGNYKDETTYEVTIINLYHIIHIEF
jgi:hypothetical protein